MLSHISFLSIPVTDQARARKFYSECLEMTVAVDEPYGDARWIMLEIPGAQTRLHLDLVEEMPDRQTPTLPLITKNIVPFVEKLRGKDVEVVSEPKAAEWNPDATYALIRDSEGNLVLLASE